MCKLYWSDIHLNCLYCMQMILFFLFHFIVFTFTWSLIRQLWTTNQIFSYFTTTDRPLPVLVAKHSHTHTHRGTVQVSQQALLSCQSSSFCGGTEGQDKLQRGWGAELPPAAREDIEAHEREASPSSLAGCDGAAAGTSGHSQEACS